VETVEGEVIMKKFYCDKCKEEKAEHNLTTVQLTVGTVGLYGKGDYAKIDLCDNCLKNIGITEQDNDRHKYIESKNDADKLYDLIRDIVRDCTD
jgi:hypothetical protein